MHGLLLLGELPGFLLLSLFSILAGSLCCPLACPLCFPYLSCHLLLQSCHLAQGSLVLFAALLVFAHPCLQRMHLSLLSRQLAHILPFLCSFTSSLACPLCFPYLSCHLLLQSCHLAQGSLVLFAALLVFAHPCLQRMHLSLLSRQLAH